MPFTDRSSSLHFDSLPHIADKANLFDCEHGSQQSRHLYTRDRAALARILPFVVNEDQPG